MSRLLYGDSAAREVSKRVAATVTTVTTLKAIKTDRCVHGMLAFVQSDNSIWQFHDSCALTGDDILIAEPSDGGAGAWLRKPGGCELKLPFTYATADAAILLTIPTGALLLVDEFYWQISADMTGGVASAIGVSSSNKSDSAAFTTKGDFLGGATGDVAATLTAALGSIKALGTIGTDWDTVAKRRTLFVPTDTIRFDRITSAFAAGTGNVCVAGTLLRNAGA